VKTIITLLAAIMLAGCGTMKMDMTDFTGVTLPAGMQSPEAVPVRMAAFNDLQEVQRLCSMGDKRQQAAERGGVYFGCAMTTDNGCFIVIWTQTAYQVIGHEFMHCMWTPRAMTGKTEGLPVHFVPPSKRTK